MDAHYTEAILWIAIICSILLGSFFFYLSVDKIAIPLISIAAVLGLLLAFIGIPIKQKKRVS